MFKKLWQLLIIMLFTLTFFAIFTGNSYAAKTVNMNGDMPVNHFISKAMNLFADKVKNYTDGSIIVNTYPAQSLLSDKIAVTSLSKGSVELVETGSGGEIESLVPEVVPLAGPTYTDINWFYRFLYDKNNGGGWIEKVFAPELEKANIKFLATMLYSPSFSVMTNKKINNVSDYKGLKLRAANKGYAALLEGVGAKPMVMSSSDVYMAIERGVIDGGISGCTSFVARKWYEVADYAQVLNVGPHSFILAANLDFWNSLTKAEKKGMIKAAKETELWVAQQAVNDRENSIKTLKEKGVEVTRYEVGSQIWEDLREKGWDNVKKEVLEKQLGNSYSETMQMINNTRTGSITWEEAIKQSY